MSKKFYKNPPKEIVEKTKPKPAFNKEQSDVYNGFYGNVERLESEWNLCQKQYDIAMQVIKAKDINFEIKVQLQKISQYWNSRKIAMERTLDNDMLEKFKTKRNASKKA